MMVGRWPMLRGARGGKHGWIIRFRAQSSPGMTLPTARISGAAHTRYCDRYARQVLKVWPDFRDRGAGVAYLQSVLKRNDDCGSLVRRRGYALELRLWTVSTDLAVCEPVTSLIRRAVHLWRRAKSRLQVDRRNAPECERNGVEISHLIQIKRLADIYLRGVYHRITAGAFGGLRLILCA